jgi:hypothetical protein
MNWATAVMHSRPPRRKSMSVKIESLAVRTASPGKADQGDARTDLRCCRGSQAVLCYVRPVAPQRTRRADRRTTMGPGRIRWDDPHLNINWPNRNTVTAISPEDRMLPTFNDWRRKSAVDVDRGDSLNYDETYVRRHRLLSPEPVST